MNARRYVDELDDLIHNAKLVPLTTQVRIDRDQIYNALDRLRGALPDEAQESQRTHIARDVYEAFAAGDRETVERHYAANFTFSAPPDPLLDRGGFFERCWPGAGSGERFVFKRLIEIGHDQVLVTYERTRNDGGRGRNTEILTFEGDQIVRAEVYFGWNLT